jgi:O-acetyl-ADP-ribose deacetylase (regulator of RNase III)/uncharacterized protein YwgA
MIQYLIGNIFESKAEALVNTVNTVGVMGKGIALQYKKAFPHNYKVYSKACKDGEIQIGKLLVVKDQNISTGDKWIINFPTKTDWRKPSQYSYVEEGLDTLVKLIEEYGINSIAIPPLGAGNGGLEWEKVKKIIERKLKDTQVSVLVYEPSDHIKEEMKKERVKLTPARALLLYILYDLVGQGEYVSEFSSEKICYFLQRFGAQKYFNLDFKPNFYGPYSGKVRFVLNALNGSYLMGYSDMDKKAFDPLTLVEDGKDAVVELVEGNPELKIIADNTKKFLDGFYSDFALELLSSIDYIKFSTGAVTKEEIMERLSLWSDRKRSLFSNPKYLSISLDHLKNTTFPDS